LFEDRNDPANIIELYSFTFNYAVSSNGSRTIAAMEISGPAGQQLTIKQSNAGVQTLLRKIAFASSSLPLLPESCFMEMRLYHTDDCPNDYQPPGFVPSLGATDLFFPLSSGWRKTDSTVGAISTGHHSVCINMSYLASEMNDADSAMDVAEDKLPQIPNDLIYKDRHDALEALDLKNAVPLLRIGGSSTIVQTEHQTHDETESTTTHDSGDLNANNVRKLPISGLVVKSSEEHVQVPGTPMEVDNLALSSSNQLPPTRPEDKLFRDRIARMVRICSLQWKCEADILR
jgi:meiosis-specific protein